MRVVSIKALKAFWLRHPQAEKPLRLWYKTATQAQWRNFMEVRESFRSVDVAKVASGSTATIFDIGGNKYRLITAIHYNTGHVYAMRVLTHQEYDGNKWKDEQ